MKCKLRLNIRYICTVNIHVNVYVKTGTGKTAIKL